MKLVLPALGFIFVILALLVFTMQIADSDLTPSAAFCEDVGGSTSTACVAMGGVEAVLPLLGIVLLVIGGLFALGFVFSMLDRL